MADRRGDRTNRDDAALMMERTRTRRTSPESRRRTPRRRGLPSVLRTLDPRLGAVIVVTPAITLAAASFLPDAGPADRTGLLLVALTFASLIPIVEGGLRGAQLLELGVAVALVYVLLFPARAAAILLGLEHTANPEVYFASNAVIHRTLLLATAGLLAGGLAYISPLGPALGRRVSLPHLAICERPPLGYSVLVFGLGLAAQAFVLAGDYVPRLERLLAGRGSGVISATSALMVVGLAFLTHRAVAPDASKRNVLILAGAATACLVVSVIGQFKEVAVLAVGTPFVVATYTLRRRPRLRWLVAAVAVLVLMFVAVTIWRYASDRIGTANPSKVARAIPTQLIDYSWSTPGRRPLRPWSPPEEVAQLISRRFYGFDSLTLAVGLTPSVYPHQNGATLENLAAGLVPRLLWPGKPQIGIGYWFAQVYWPVPQGATQVPQAVTHPGELWIDFGWAGVIVGMAALGLCYRFAVTAIRPGQSAAGTLLYPVVLLTVVVVDRDIPLVYVTLVQRLAVTAIVLAAGELIYRRRLRSAPSAASP